MRRALAVALCVSILGCASVRGHLRPPAPPQPSGEVQAGAARADITPPPGYPMGGYSWAGYIGEGYWTRLRARAVYVEDADGHGLVLVATDLWSIPEGLTDEVAALLAEDRVPIAREQILLTASHTHHSPAAYSTDRFFTIFAGFPPGFDRGLFDFLARRIATAIGDAYGQRVPARIAFGRTYADRVFRNRSYSAFVHDPEAAQFVQANAGLTSCENPDYAPDACRAIDPSISVLRLDPAAGGPPIAIAAFLAAHATIIDHHSTLYSSDLFGVAATTLERRLQAAGGGDPVVALINGAEGDVSFAWYAQDRPTLLRIAERVEDGIRRALAAATTFAQPNVTYATTRVALGNQCAQGGEQLAWTPSSPMPGAATICGAEDGRSCLPAWFTHEGTRGTRSGRFGVKLGALDPHIGHWRLLPFSITRLIVRGIPSATEVPLGIYRVGPLTLIGLPGEFTTVLAMRIRDAVTRALPSPRSTTVLTTGLTNGYAYYFATAEEYERQHYEGSGTMFGPAVGAVLIDRYATLARSVPPTPAPPVERSFHHTCGLPNEFGVTRLALNPSPAGSAGFQWILREAAGDFPKRPRPEFCWRDVRPAFDATVLPRVRVEQQVADGGWQPLVVDGDPQDDGGERFVVRAGSAGSCTRWCATWIPPKGVDPDVPLRFAVTSIAGSIQESADFDLSSWSRDTRLEGRAPTDQCGAHTGL